MKQQGVARRLNFQAVTALTLPNYRQWFIAALGERSVSEPSALEQRFAEHRWTFILRT